MKNFKTLIAVLTLSVLATSCTTTKQNIKEANVRVEFQKEDFELTKQVSGEATVTRILTVDWERLKDKEIGEVNNGLVPISLSSIPVIGEYVSTTANNYALYKLLEANPGYDVVIYPQFHVVEKKPILGIGLFKTVTTVTVKARLAKLKP
ncbi:MAG: DUF6567 family protein [Bacteroidia bacterium]